MECGRCVIFFRDIQNDLTCAGDAAPDDDRFRIHHCRDHGKRLTESLSERVHHGNREFIALLRLIEDLLRGEPAVILQGGCLLVLRKLLPCYAHDSACRSVLLKASLLAAVAGIRLVIGDLHVTDLSACAMGARKDLPVQNNSAADTGSERDEDHVLKALSAALPLLAECRDIRVVPDLHLHAVKKPRQRGSHVDDAPVKIDRLVDNTVLQNRAWHADAEAFDLICRDLLLFQLLPDRSGNVLQNVAPVVLGSGRDLPAFYEFFLLRIKKAVLDRCAAYIDSECILLHHLSSLQYSSFFSQKTVSRSAPRHRG